MTVPQTTLEQRTVTAGDRRITVARPAGFTRSVETHAGDTVRHALSPRVSRSAHEREASPPTTSRVSTAQSNPRGPHRQRAAIADQRKIRVSDQRSTRDDRSVATPTTRTNVESSRSRRDLVDGPAVEREKRESASNPPVNRRGEPMASEHAAQRKHQSILAPADPRPDGPPGRRGPQRPPVRTASFREPAIRWPNCTRNDPHAPSDSAGRPRPQSGRQDRPPIT